MSSRMTIFQAATVFSWLSEHALHIFSLPDIFHSHLLTGSQMYPALESWHPNGIRSFDLSWKWAANPSSAQASVSPTCSSAFSSPDLRQIFDGELQTDQQDFHSFISPSTAMWHRTHWWALWAACEHFRKSCAASLLMFPGTGSSELLAMNSESRSTTRRNPSAASSPPEKTRKKKKVTATRQNKEQYAVYL